MDQEAKVNRADEIMTRSMEKSSDFKVDKSLLKETIKEMIKSGEIKI